MTELADDTKKHRGAVLATEFQLLNDENSRVAHRKTVTRAKLSPKCECQAFGCQICVALVTAHHQI